MVKETTLFVFICNCILDMILRNKINVSICKYYVKYYLMCINTIYLYVVNF